MYELLPETLSGGASDDYYWSYWVSGGGVRLSVETFSLQKLNLSYTIELDPVRDNHQVYYRDLFLYIKEY